MAEASERTAARPIPQGPSDVTAEWLSRVLSRSGEPVEVADVDVRAVGTGQTGATFRVTANYTRRPDGLPDTYVVKLPAQDESVRERVALGYRSECAFYASVADRVTVPVPDCFHCEIDDATADYVLLLADQSPAVQGDQLAGCTTSEAVLAVQAIAGLHGPTWCEPRWRDFQGLAFTLADEAAVRGLGDIARMSGEITLDKLGGRLCVEDRDTVSQVTGRVTDWLLAEPERFSLMHGDYRLDNLLFDRDAGRVTVVDWQTLGVGLPARDLAYFAGTSLEPEARRATESLLVDEYHRALLATGVSDYSRETCWQDYRFGMVQVLMISCLGFAFAADSTRGDEMIVAMLRRGCDAVRDLGTLELFSTAK